LGYLLHVILAIAVVSVAESGQTTGWRAPWVVPWLAGLAYVPAVLAKSAALRGRFVLASRYLHLVRLSPVASFAVAVLVLGWYEWVHAWLSPEEGPTTWPGPALLAVLAPFVLYGLVAIDAHVRANESLPSVIRRQRRFHARMFLATLAPFVLFVFVTWALGSNESVRVHVEEVAAFGAIFAVVLLVVFVLLLPRLLTWAWSTRPIPAGPVRAVLERLAARAGFRCRDLFVWNTEHLVANAAIVGLVPIGRAVLFTDALLSMLSLRELVAVFGHEVGHAKRRHVLVFVAWALAFLMALDALLVVTEPRDTTDALLFAGPLIVAGLIGFRWMSRRFELDADLYATEVTGDPDALASALVRVGGPHGMQRSSWRHFSTEKRLAFLNRVAREPGFARRFRGRLRRVAGLALVVFVLASAGQAWVLTRSWHEGHLMAALRLGRYAEAAERLDRIDDADEVLGRVVATVALLGQDVSVERTEKAALAAAHAGRWQEAADLVEVLVLRGRPLGWVLDALASGEVNGASSERDARWVAALRAR